MEGYLTYEGYVPYSHTCLLILTRYSTVNFSCKPTLIKSRHPVVQAPVAPITTIYCNPKISAVLQSPLRTEAREVRITGPLHPYRYPYRRLRSPRYVLYVQLRQHHSVHWAGSIVQYQEHGVSGCVGIEWSRCTICIDADFALPDP